MKTKIAFLLMITSQLSSAQLSDPIFPKPKRINAGVISTYTGNPAPVAIFDVTYGVTKKTSLGLVAGTTGQLALTGLKLNTILFQKEKFRGVFRWNAIYYPGRDGRFLFDNSIKHVMPWMFTMGIADAEWKTKNGTRWTLGVGYLETHCIDGMMHALHLSREEDDGDELPLQFYNVVHAGVSIPLSKKIFLRPEVVVAMRGFDVIKKTEDSKVSPYNPYLNLVYVF